MIHAEMETTTHAFTKSYATSFAWYEENYMKGMSTVMTEAQSGAEKKPGRSHAFYVSRVRPPEAKFHASSSKRATRQWNC